MAKKKLTIEDVLVPKEEIPYEVPENWCWVKWEYILSDDKYSMKRGPFGSSLKKSFFVEQGENTYKVYEQKNAIYDDNTLGEYYIDGEKYNELITFKVEQSDLIISCSGTLGRISEIKDGFKEGVINQALLKLSLNKNIISNDYFIHLFRSSEFQDKILNKSQGSAIVNMMSVKELKQLPIPLPPLAEQERIVKRIESLFDKVDRAAGLVDEARDGFEKRRAAILERAFSGELTKKWREENGVCDEWKIEKLSEYVKLISGQHIMNKDYNDERIGIPYLTGPSDFEEIYPVISKWTEKPKALATTEDILITVKGSGVGKVNICNIEEVAISRQLMAIRCVDIENIYLFWYLKNKFNLLQQLSTGTAIPGLSRSDILDMEISVCSKEEQKKVVCILECLLNKEREVEEVINISNNIDVVKKSILAKAFRGELGSNNLYEESSIEILKTNI